MTASGKRTRVVVIGLDCVEPQLLFERFRGKLPVLESLMARGVSGRLRSCDPPITVPAWSSMMSSKDPGTLGIYGFRNRSDHSYDKLSFATNLAVREPRVWDYLGRAGKKVVLHYNPLWMKDPSADLQEKDSQLNHPDLVPQFFPSIPSNKASASDKIGRVVDRNVPFAGWNSHLQQAYFGRGPGDDPGPFNPMSIPRWTLEHAYANPVRQLTRGLPPPDDTLHEDPVTWTVRGIKVQRLPWVAPADSLEWSYFQRAVDLLQARGNRVFVVVGPFNEHALTKPNRQDYERIKKGLESWLQERNIPHVFPALLPSDTFADLSHPLSAGYQILARELSKNEFFR